MAGTMRGRFIPKNPQKYLGNPNNVLFRSSWERTLFIWLDKTNSVLGWSSEEFSLPYISPIDNKIHKYYPDVFVIYRDVNNQIKKEIVEVKPYKETVLTPKSTDRDKMAWVINQAKWSAASKFATQQGMQFRVLTERSLYLSGKKSSK